MQPRALLLIALILVPASLAGCIGNTDALELLSTDVEPTGNVVEIKMWVETIRTEIYPGFEAEIWAFCAEPMPGSEENVELRGGEPCSVPGPTIKADQGDRMIVHFRNPHSFPHTIHWHGQTLSWEDDGVPGTTQNTTEQGHEYTYDYIVKRAGTLMYHCHVDTQHHVLMGLYGAMIVDPQDQSREPAADRDYTLVLSHGNKSHMAVPPPGSDPHAAHRGEYGSGNPGKQNGPMDVEYDLFMINGKSFPSTLEDPESLVKVSQGELVRLRFLNIGFMTESMHLHGHDMLVTHKDGVPLQEGARWSADTIRLAPGERYDVLVKAENPGKWVLHTHFPQHVTNDDMYPGGMLTQMVYDGYEDAKFRAELPGGNPEAGLAPSQPPVPEDWTDQQTGEVTDVEFTQSYTVPVEDERVSKIQLDLSLESTFPVDELTVTLVDPDGNEVDSATATNQAPQVSLTSSGEKLVGSYNAVLSGQGLQASFTLDMLVDYTQTSSGDGHGGHSH